MRQFIGPVPQRIARLPRDKRGFPVPWFVQWIDGEPHFPIMDAAHLREAIVHSKCWICGGQLGGYKAFVIGPMCVCNRLSAEPPSHLDCARFAALNCPFLANPRVGRSFTEADVKATGAKVAGIMIERNPGVTCIWVAKSYKLERSNGVLFRIGPASAVSFWAKGRAATRAEVDHSVATGLPILRRMAAKDGPTAQRDLERQVDAMTMLLDGLTWPDEPIAPDVDLKALGLHDEEAQWGTAP